MPNNIQTIIDKFDKEFYPLDDTDILVDNFKNGKFWGRKKTLEEAKQFLKDSLTSMLDGIEKEAIEQSTGGADRYEIPYITMGRLLNIINSHR